MDQKIKKEAWDLLDGLVTGLDILESTLTHARAHFATMRDGLGPVNPPDPVTATQETPPPTPEPAPAAPTPAAPAPEPAAPTPAAPAPGIPVETVRETLAELARAGHQEQIRQALLKLGANRLSEVPPTQYPELLDAARGMSEATRNAA